MSTGRLDALRIGVQPMHQKSVAGDKRVAWVYFSSWLESFGWFQELPDMAQPV